MVKKLPAALLVLSSLIVPTIAKADLLYNFNFASTDGNYHASGTLTTSSVLDAVGGYDITGITGSVTGAGGGTISSLISNPSAPYPYVLPGSIIPGWTYEIDNVLFPSASPTLDVWGVVFTVGTNIWNLWGNPSNSYELDSFTALGNNTIAGSVDELGTMTTTLSGPSTSVPEPGTLGLLGLGLMGLGLLKRRKQKTA